MSASSQWHGTGHFWGGLLACVDAYKWVYVDSAVLHTGNIDVMHIQMYWMIVSPEPTVVHPADKIWEKAAKPLPLL